MKRTCPMFAGDPDHPDTCDTCAGDFLREVELRAGATREERLKYLTEEGRRYPAPFQFRYAKEWLSHILGDRP